MTTFRLKIVTPDGLMYDGEAEKLLVRSTGGDVCILARHMNYLAPLDMGVAIVEAAGKRRRAACIGGMLSVHSGAVNLVPTTFEWAEQIDPERLRRSIRRANQVLEDPAASDAEIALAQARLHRALVRERAISFP